MHYKTLDLFAGAGGLSYGFEMTGKFEIVAAAELNKNAQDTYKCNHHYKDDIEMVSDVRGCDFKNLSQKLGGIDVVIGGPPCQGFSNANRQKNHIISMNNSLVKEYFRAIREINPRAFVMENVSMLSSNTHRFYDSYIDHEDIVDLGIDMREDELVIAEDGFNGFNVFELLNNNNEGRLVYRIDDDLYQTLNVLYKDRKSKTDRFKIYIEKNSSQIIKKINKYFDKERHHYHILDDIVDAMNQETIEEKVDSAKRLLNTLGAFLKFQKSFKLLEELEANEIIYVLDMRPNTNAIIARVHSYAVIDYVKRILGEDYITSCGVVNSLWFGVPQERKRFIVMGVRSDVNPALKVKIPTEPNEYKVVTVGEALLDLVDNEVVNDLKLDKTNPYISNENLSDYAKKMRNGSKGVKNHLIPKTTEVAKKRFSELKTGENFHKLSSDLKDTYADPDRTQNSIYLRLNPEEPSGTVTNVRKSMWIHPTLNRAVSVREAARLQSFPDSFEFKGKKDSQYQQVGNAVPPLMAKGIAEELLNYI